MLFVMRWYVSRCASCVRVLSRFLALHMSADDDRLPTATGFRRTAGHPQLCTQAVGGGPGGCETHNGASHNASVTKLTLNARL